MMIAVVIMMLLIALNNNDDNNNNNVDVDNNKNNVNGNYGDKSASYITANHKAVPEHGKRKTKYRK